MAGSDDLQLAADVKREMLTKLKVIQERLKNIALYEVDAEGGFPTSRELRVSLLEITELVDILIRKA